MAIPDLDQDLWPIFGICIRTPMLELRPLHPGDWFALADLAGRGIHEPDEMPFAEPWSDAAPPVLQRTSVQFYAKRMAEFSPAAWGLPFSVRRDGELVGTQEVMTRDFAIVRGFETGSWVGREFQRQGIGSEMRAAVLQFMFDGLGALDAFTSAWDDNASSQAVTAKLGYRPYGGSPRVRRGERVEMHAYRLARTDWEPHRRDDIEVDGLTDEAISQFGLA